MKALQNIGKVKLPDEQILDLLRIYEVKGECLHIAEVFKTNAKTFSKAKDLENMYFLAKILGIDFNDAKLKRFAKSNLASKNKDEQYFNNLKRALKLVADYGNDFSILANDVIALSKMLAKGIKNNALNELDDLKESFLVNKESENVRVLLQEFIDFFQRILHHNDNERLSMLIAFYIDFVSLNFFKHYNKEIALVIFYGFLQKEFKTFQYVPFFKYLYEDLETFKNTEAIALANWKVGVPDVIGVLKILIPLIKKAGVDLAKLKQSYKFEVLRNKSDTLEYTILKGPQVFTKEDLRKKHPRVSDSTINRALKRLKEEGKIMPLGTGRSAVWQRIVEGEENNLDFGIFSETRFSKSKK